MPNWLGFLAIVPGSCLSFNVFPFNASRIALSPLLLVIGSCFVSDVNVIAQWGHHCLAVLFAGLSLIINTILLCKSVWTGD